MNVRSKLTHRDLPDRAIPSPTDCTLMGLISTMEYSSGARSHSEPPDQLLLPFWLHAVSATPCLCCVHPVPVHQSSPLDPSTLDLGPIASVGGDALVIEGVHSPFAMMEGVSTQYILLLYVHTLNCRKGTNHHHDRRLRGEKGRYSRLSKPESRGGYGTSTGSSSLAVLCMYSPAYRVQAAY